ncbi:MAG: c-type cytochrome [Burkholderiales bacterium]|nr:MAG: c-type cytochrome [Burkholderiales bacterium]
MKRLRERMIRAALLLCLGVLTAAAASAQSRPAAAGKDPATDMRAVLASPSDIGEGRKVAQASCANCHGMDGHSTGKNVPHIAGQRPGYLYAEMRVYQAGGRPDKSMVDAVKFMNDDALWKVAAYYGSLEPAPPVAVDPKAAAKAAARADPVKAGKAVADSCGGCHGETGVSSMAGMPNLVALDPKHFYDATVAYKNGQRKHDMMKQIAAGMSDADLKNVALFYALQKPEKAKTPAAGDATAGERAAAASCAGCHGDRGVTSSATVPNLAGQDAEYFIEAMRAYKSGARSDETMKNAVAKLDEATIKNLAAYYAKQQPLPTKARAPLSTAEWVQRCDRCHGVNGNSTDPHMPAIAGQRADYHEKVLHAYRTGERKSSAMSAMSGTLTEADVEALAAYYARQKPRSVIYVPVPAK